jgi:hypothetical protein
MEIVVVRRFLVSASERAFSPIAFCERALGVAISSTLPTSKQMGS